MTTSDHEFEEIIEKYEEEILVQEEVLQPPLTDSADTVPAQGKPRYITLIFIITICIYVMCIYVTRILWKPHAQIYLSYESYQCRFEQSYAQVFGSVRNLSLLTIGGYYYYSHNKMMKRKQRPYRDMVWILVGVTGCVLRPMGLILVTLFSLSVSIKDCPLLWMVVRSQTYYPERILAYGSRKAHYTLVAGSSSFRTD